MIPVAAMPFTIRPARVEDADAIAHVHHQSWEETYPGLMPPELLERVSLDHRLAQWRRGLAAPAPGLARFVAERDEDMTAIAQCGPPQDADLGTTHEIWLLYVLRKAQGLGLGVALMKTMFDHLRMSRPAGDGEPPGQPEFGAVMRPPDESVGLWVLTRNEPAIRFYERLGARRDRTIRRGEWNGAVIEDVAMRWERAPEL
jgi:ribosomal protein S18 acetylase RimI-like enzyme